MSGSNVRNIRYPFLIRAIGSKISGKFIFVFVNLIAVFMVFPPSDNGQKVVFPHNSQDCLRVMMDSVSVQPYLYSAVSIGSAAFLLTFPDLLCKSLVFGRCVHPMDIVVVSASGHTEKTAHSADAVLVFVAVDYHIFNADLHFLSVCERKSLSSSFSISKLLMRASFRASL